MFMASAEKPATTEPDAWECPKCGRVDWRVADSRFDGSARNRQRVCKHCKAFISTQEVPVPFGHVIRVVPKEGDR